MTLPFTANSLPEMIIPTPTDKCLGVDKIVVAAKNLQY